MNNGGKNDPDDFRSLRLMAELEDGRPISQREIAGRLGIALGLVNSYLKSLVARGLVTVKAYPRNRYAYLLTPQGFAEKSQLAYRHLNNFHALYRITRQDSLALFQTLLEQGVARVSFCGLDDLTEIAFLSLREAGLELATVMDEEGGGNFLGMAVVSLAEGVARGREPIVITSLQRAARLKEALLELGVAEQDMHAPSYGYEDVLR